MMGWYGGGMGSVGWLGMGLFWLILLGLIVWLVARLLPGSGGGTTRDTGESALEILDRRLAGRDRPGSLAGPTGRPPGRPARREVTAMRRPVLVGALVAAVIALVASAAVAVGTLDRASLGALEMRGYGQAQDRHDGRPRPESVVRNDGQPRSRAVRGHDGRLNDGFDGLHGNRVAAR